jgi:hypothetical protein
MENQFFPLLVQEEKIKYGKLIFSPPDSGGKNKIKYGKLIFSPPGSGGKNKIWKINIFPSWFRRKK